MELCEVGDEQRDAEGVEVGGGVEHSGARALQGFGCGSKGRVGQTEMGRHAAGTGRRGGAKGTKKPDREGRVGLGGGLGAKVT